MCKRTCIAGSQPGISDVLTLLDLKYGRTEQLRKIPGLHAAVQFYHTQGLTESTHHLCQAGIQRYMSFCTLIKYPPASYLRAHTNAFGIIFSTRKPNLQHYKDIFCCHSILLHEFKPPCYIYKPVYSTCPTSFTRNTKTSSIHKPEGGSLALSNVHTVENISTSKGSTDTSIISAT